tara:strand:+ start:164 stop:367 length:204 start_codon:yes stop_codon:yes gene_type:complete
MPVKSLKTDIIDKRPNDVPQTNAKIRNVDGTIFATVTSDPIDKNNLSEKQKINSETGYFGTKISNPE